MIVITWGQVLLELCPVWMYSFAHFSCACFEIELKFFKLHDVIIEYCEKNHERKRWNELEIVLSRTNSLLCGTCLWYCARVLISHKNLQSGSKILVGTLLCMKTR